VLGFASMALGLLLSSLVDTSDKAMPLLVVVVMFQVVLSGGVFPLQGKAGLEQVAWVSPSRWGYAAAGATVNLNAVIPPTAAAAGARGPAVTVASLAPVRHKPKSPSASPSPSPSPRPAGAAATASSSSDPLWDHTVKTWLTDMACLLALALAFSLLTWRRLVKMGPVKRK
jgi:ABC transport system ATP-binding/permease protein